MRPQVSSVAVPSFHVVPPIHFPSYVSTVATRDTWARASWPVLDSPVDRQRVQDLLKQPAVHRVVMGPHDIIPPPPPASCSGAEVTGTLRAMLESMLREASPAESWIILDGYSVMHRAMQQRGLVSTDDSLPDCDFASWCAASAVDQANLLAAAVVRSERDALEAALHYYGLPVRALPDGATCWRDPTGTFDALVEQLKACSASIAECEQGTAQATPRLWPHVAAHCARRDGAQIYEAFIDFVKGDDAGPKGSVAFSVPLFVLRIDRRANPPCSDLPLGEPTVRTAQREPTRWRHLAPGHFAAEPEHVCDIHGAARPASEFKIR